MKSATGLVRGVAGILIVAMTMVASADTFYVNGACGNDDWAGTSSVCWNHSVLNALGDVSYLLIDFSLGEEECT